MFTMVVLNLFYNAKMGNWEGFVRTAHLFGNGKIPRNSVAAIIFCAVNTSQYIAIVCKHYMEWWFICMLMRKCMLYK